MRRRPKKPRPLDRLARYALHVATKLWLARLEPLSPLCGVRDCAVCADVLAANVANACLAYLSRRRAPLSELFHPYRLRGFRRSLRRAFGTAP